MTFGILLVVLHLDGISFVFADLECELIQSTNFSMVVGIFNCFSENL
jgi:hypothetical protein